MVSFSYIRNIQIEPTTSFISRTCPRRTRGLFDLSRHPENVAIPGILILRLEGPIYFANAQTVRDGVKPSITVLSNLHVLSFSILLAQDNLDMQPVQKC